MSQYPQTTALTDALARAAARPDQSVDPLYALAVELLAGLARRDAAAAPTPAERAELARAWALDAAPADIARAYLADA